MICGACKERHEKVADVKQCYDDLAQVDADAAIEQRYERMIESPEFYGLPVRSW